MPPFAQNAGALKMLAVIEAVKVATTTARGRGARAWRRAMLQRLSDPGLRVKLGVVRVTVVR